MATRPVQTVELVRGGASTRNSGGLTLGLALVQAAVPKAKNQSTPCRKVGGMMADLDSTFSLLTLKKSFTLSGTSLVAQWLRIHLPRQGTQVRSLVWEDPTCRGATKPVCHNY